MQKDQFCIPFIARYTCYILYIALYYIHVLYTLYIVMISEYRHDHGCPARVVRPQPAGVLSPPESSRSAPRARGGVQAAAERGLHAQFLLAETQAQGRVSPLGYLVRGICAEWGFTSALQRYLQGGPTEFYSGN